MNLDRTLVRLKNLKDQTPRDYILSVGSIEQGAMYVSSITVAGEVVYAYVAADDPLASIVFPVAAGFLLLPVTGVELTTVENMLRQQHADETRARELEKEFHPEGHPHTSQLGHSVDTPPFPTGPSVPLPGQYI